MDLLQLAEPAVIMAFAWAWWKIALIIFVAALLIAAFFIRRTETGTDGEAGKPPKE